MQQTNYFSTASNIRSHFSADEQSMRKIYDGFINNGPQSPEISSFVGQYIYPYIPHYHFRQEPAQGELQQFFDEYIKQLRIHLSPETFSIFSRFLSLYISGRIGHRLFVRLLLRNVFPPSLRDSADYMQLPVFLSSINSGSIFLVGSSYSTESEEFAAEFIIGTTAMITTPEAAKSLNKCLTLLSNGLISKSIALPWLSKFCPPDILSKLEKVTDFSAFHPSLFPPDYILCGDFPTDSHQKNVIDSFKAENANSCDLRKVATEVIETKLLGLRQIIALLADGPDIKGLDGSSMKASDLQFAYGEKAAKIVSQLPAIAPIVIMRLSKIYDELQSLYVESVFERLEGIQADGPEYRILLKALVKHNTLAFHFQLPGIRSIPFRSRTSLMSAIAFVNTFYTAIFGGENKVEGPLKMILSIFADRGVRLVVYEKQIFAVAYLSAIAKMIENYLGEEQIEVEGEIPHMKADQLSSKPKALLQYTVWLKTQSERPFTIEPIQHIDLLALRCVRALTAFDGVTKLLPFPSEINEMFIITTMHLSEEEEKMYVVCNSAFSPCFSEASSDTEENTQGSS